MFGLNPYVIAGALVLWIGTGLGAYFYGHNEGANAVKAQMADAQAKALQDFSKAAGDIVRQASADAMKDFADKTAILQQVADSLSKAQGVMNAASNKLAVSLKGGSCVLNPAQRQLLECVRRPGTAGCATPAPAG